MTKYSSLQKTVSYVGLPHYKKKTKRNGLTKGYRALNVELQCVCFASNDSDLGIAWSLVSDKFNKLVCLIGNKLIVTCGIFADF